MSDGMGVGGQWVGPDRSRGQIGWARDPAQEVSLSGMGYQILDGIREGGWAYQVGNGVPDRVIVLDSG